MTDTERAIQEYYELTRKTNEIKARQEELKTQILEAMADSETDTMMAGTIKAMSKTVHASRFDSKRFKEDHQDLYNQYTKKSFQTRFTVNMIKAK